MSEETKERPKIAWALADLSEATTLSMGQLRKEINAGRLEIIKCGRRTLALDPAVQKWLSTMSTQKAG